MEPHSKMKEQHFLAVSFKLRTDSASCLVFCISCIFRSQEIYNIKLALPVQYWIYYTSYTHIFMDIILTVSNTLYFTAFRW